MWFIVNFGVRSVSVVVVVAASAVWVRSYFVSDSYGLPLSQPSAAAMERAVDSVGTAPGRIVAYRRTPYM